MAIPNRKKLVYHRNVNSASAAAPWGDAGGVSRSKATLATWKDQKGTLPNRVASVEGHPNIVIPGLWVQGASSENDTFLLNIVGWDKHEASQTPSTPYGRLLLSLTCTVGTHSVANVNPISGEVVAATFFAVDTIVVDTAVSHPYYELICAAGGNGVAQIDFATMLVTDLFCFLTTIHNDITDVHVPLLLTD